VRCRRAPASARIQAAPAPRWRCRTAASRPAPAPSLAAAPPARSSPTAAPPTPTSNIAASAIPAVPPPAWARSPSCPPAGRRSAADRSPSGSRSRSRTRSPTFPMAGPPAPNGARTTLYHLNSSDGTAISKYWDLKSAQQPTAQDDTTLTFDYSDASTGWETVPNAITATNYQGVMSPVDTSLPLAEQTIFTRYWNVFNVDLVNAGSAQGKLVQIVVRWKEPNFGYRSVTNSFF